MSVGKEVDDLTDAARSFHQATRMAEATPPGQALPEGRSFHEPSDVGLRRLLYALRGNPRIQEYIERVLGCDLGSGGQRTALHVALTALDMLRAR